MTVEALIKALQKEAGRRASLGHHPAAHELRGEASAIRRAEAALRYSKQVR